MITNVTCHVKKGEAVSDNPIVFTTINYGSD